MKILKNRKGFTLIELLAVIVVLAIISVLASTAILSYIQSARRDSFAIEVDEAVSAASDAVSLINLGMISSGYTTTTTGYCFTLAQLKALNLYDKDLTDYAGAVTVTLDSSTGTYSYAIVMHSGGYALKLSATAGSATNNTDSIVTYTSDSNPSGYTYTCS